MQLHGEGLVLLGDPVADVELIDELVQRPGEQTAPRGVVQAADRRPADQAGRRLAGPVGLQGAVGTGVGMPVADARPERHLEPEIEADAGGEPELQLGPGAVIGDDRDLDAVGRGQPLESHCPQKIHDHSQAAACARRQPRVRPGVRPVRLCSVVEPA